MDIFFNCDLDGKDANIISADLSNFDYSLVNFIKKMFCKCSGVKEISCNKKINF